MAADFVIEPLAEDALLLRFGEGIDMETNARVHAAARGLRAAGLPGVTDVAPAYATLLLRFVPGDWLDGTGEHPFARITAALHEILGPGLCRDDEQRIAERERKMDRTAEIPVCYGGDFGPDLDAVAAHAHVSPDDVVVRHAAGEYTVAMLGFAPGFPYLLGLDPTLWVPRHANPRTRVPAGSVAIGGAQTGIYPRELPGGWHLIGRTPLALFDPARAPPCLLAPGDRVRFHVIDANEFARLAERGA
ncbi:MAG: 5-oxoprolinase subunit PxpB [Rhodanobacteraceae bacterium]|nr:MAG: 5-oxoprolinase subunit PxpB [Rhodanobacteraceae bacterium]